MISQFSFQVEDADTTYSDVTMTIEVDLGNPSRGLKIMVDGKTYSVSARNTENLSKILDMAVQP